MGTLKELAIEIKIDPTSAVRGLRAVDTETKKIIEDTKKLDSELKKTESSFEDAERATIAAANARKKADDEAAAASKKRRDSLKAELGSIASFGSGVAKSIAVGVTALAGSSVLAAKFVADWAHGAVEVDRTAKQFGLSAQALQELQYAAKSTGGSGEAIGEVFKEMSIRLTDAALTGAGPATDALNSLGLSAKELLKLKPEERFAVLADSVAKVSDEGKRFFLKDSLFGEEGGIKIGNLLEEGSIGIAKLRAEAVSLGGVLGGKSLKDAVAFNKELVKTNEVVSGLKSTLATALLPIVKDVIEKTAKWAQSNRELISTKVANFAKAIADAAATIGPILGGALSMAGQLTDAMGGLGNTLIAGGVAWGAWKLAALASLGPVGAAVAALTAGFAAGAILANALKNDEDPEVTKQKLRQTKVKSYAGSVDRFANDTSPNGMLARKQFEVGLSKLEYNPNDADAERMVNRALEEMDRIDAARAAQGGTQLKNIATNKPGAGNAPTSLAGLTKDEIKRRAELDRLRAIRLQAEERLTTAGGPDRAVLESIIGNLDKTLGGPSRDSIQELMAQAVGQGSGLGGAGIRPAGLGTSINNIDASITINVGGVDVAVPAAAIRSGDPQGSGREFGGSMMDQMLDVFENAARLQRGQILG